MPTSADYPLGYSEEEAQRLADQAALLEPFTVELFQRAGLERGMHVLDIGCGVGDVSLLAARLVGPEGRVLGMDRAASSLAIARHRARAADVRHVEFLESELEALDSKLDGLAADRPFDALVGRLVLLYLPDPDVILRRLVRHVRAHGVVAFQEFDLSPVAQAPSSALFEEVRRCILAAFKAAGANTDMGTGLYRTFVRAGLEPPEMAAAATRVASGPSTRAYEYMVRVLKSVLPVIERHGIADPRQLEVETLAQRLRDEGFAQERIAFMPRIVSAWSHIGNRS